MSRDALSQTTLALQRLVHTALGGVGQPDDLVHLGPPIPAQVGDRPVSLFAFHLEPNREMRNARRFTTAGGAPVDPTEQDALPVDLRYLISVFRPAGAVEPSELLRLGQIIAGLQETPTLGGGLLPGQEVRLTPEPYPMEELSRIWCLFPNAAYTTSMVYLASPIFIDARDLVRGAAIEERRVDSGPSAQPPDVLGDRRVTRRLDS
jgi:hypothetical protein